jgi:hypothetical protein
MAFNLKNIFSSIASKANTNRASNRAPSPYNIGKTTDWKYGHGDFAGIERRRKPGESTFQYNTRMRQQGIRATDKSDISESVLPAPGAEIKGTFSTAETYTNPAQPAPPVNPNDLRSTEEPSNFGITPGMSFGGAFAQAGKAGAKTGDIFMWEGKPFLYEFKKMNGNGDGKEEVISPHTVDPTTMHAVDPYTSETLRPDAKRQSRTKQSKKTIHEQSIDISGVSGYTGKN